MKYVAAYALLALAGNESVNAADLTKFLTAAGVSDVNNDSVTAVCNALAGKQLHEVINAGFGKISSLSLGGGSTTAATAGNAGPAKVEAQEEKKEEEEEEEEE